jgi:hypothetical protein
LVSAHIGSISNGSKNLKSIQKELATEGDIPVDTREVLGKAARTKDSSWFKNVRRMEHIGRRIVGPLMEKSDVRFTSVVKEVFGWMEK